MEVSEYTHSWISKLIFEKIILHCCYTNVVYPWSTLKQKHIQFTIYFFSGWGKDNTWGREGHGFPNHTSHRLAALDFRKKIPRTRRTPAGWVFNNRGVGHTLAQDPWRAVSRSKSGSGGTATAREASGLISTWLWLQTSDGKYKLSKPCQHSSMGQREGALMINSAKSSGFCIPMVPGLSGCHVTGPGHFLADWGKLVSKHRWFRVRPAVRDNHSQHQLCLEKLAALFVSSFASWCSYFPSCMSLCIHF